VRLPSSLTVGAVTAGAALALYVQKRHRRTGLGYLEIIRQLPGDAQRWAAAAKERAALALEDGRATAQARDEQLTRRLEAAGPPSPAAG
jgi:hypothetical protein